MDDEIIDRFNRAQALLTPHLVQRFHTYSRYAEVALVQSWSDIPDLVRRVQALEEALEQKD